jgi:hypothetical protein
MGVALHALWGTRGAQGAGGRMAARAGARPRRGGAARAWRRPRGGRQRGVKARPRPRWRPRQHARGLKSPRDAVLGPPSAAGRPPRRAPAPSHPAPPAVALPARSYAAPGPHRTPLHRLVLRRPHIPPATFAPRPRAAPCTPSPEVSSIAAAGGFAGPRRSLRAVAGGLPRPRAGVIRGVRGRVRRALRPCRPRACLWRGRVALVQLHAPAARQGRRRQPAGAAGGRLCACRGGGAAAQRAPPAALGHARRRRRRPAAAAADRSPAPQAVARPSLWARPPPPPTSALHPPAPAGPTPPPRRSHV